MNMIHVLLSFAWRERLVLHAARASWIAALVIPWAAIPVAAAETETMPVQRSPHARLRPASMDEARWTDGFWADRFRRCRRATLPAVEEGLRRDDNSEQLDVLLIAAGLQEGEREKRGTNWTDGDCYKWIEALARHYRITAAPDLLEKMDYWIDVIGQAQSPNGYLSTNFWNNPEGRLQMPYFH